MQKMAENGGEAVETGPPETVMSDDVSDVLGDDSKGGDLADDSTDIAGDLSADFGGDLGGDLAAEELDYEEEYPANTNSLEDTNNKDSQVAGDEASQDVSAGSHAGDDHHTADDQEASQDDANTGSAGADDTATTAGNGEAVEQLTNGQADDAADEGGDDNGDGDTAATGEEVSGATEGPSGLTASTGTDKEKSSEPNSRPKKPIKKITMEGFKDDSKVGIIPAVEKAETDKSCVLCNLVFSSTKELNNHRDHRDHSYAVKGKSPGSGRYQCLLCWKGFSREEYLKEHIDKKDHLDRSKDKGMLGFYSPPAKFAVMRESEKIWLRETELDRERRERLLKQADRKDRGPRRVNFNHYFEIDSIGDCDTFGVKLRKLTRDRSRSHSKNQNSSSTRSNDRKSSDRRSSARRSSSHKSSSHRSARSRSPHRSGGEDRGTDKSAQQTTDQEKEETVTETERIDPDNKMDTSDQVQVDNDVALVADKEAEAEQLEIPGEKLDDDENMEKSNDESEMNVDNEGGQNENDQEYDNQNEEGGENEDENDLEDDNENDQEFDNENDQEYENENDQEYVEEDEESMDTEQNNEQKES